MSKEDQLLRKIIGEERGRSYPRVSFSGINGWHVNLGFSSGYNLIIKKGKHTSCLVLDLFHCSSKKDYILEGVEEQIFKEVHVRSLSKRMRKLISLLRDRGYKLRKEAKIEEKRRKEQENNSLIERHIQEF